MSYITVVFRRTDAQQVAEFLASGEMLREEDKWPFETRLREVETRLMTLLEGVGLAERESEFFACCGEYGYIYMELGVRAGP